MSTETVVAHAWLEQVLLGDAALSGLVDGHIYRGAAPEDTVGPVVIWDTLGGSYTTGLGGRRVWAELVMQVKAVGDVAESGTVATIATALDTALQGAFGRTAHGAVYACIGEQPVDYDEVDSGIRYWHLGATYRVIAQAA
jgi:hypothetical protein